MLAARLHPLCRNRPQAAVSVEFRPYGAEDFAGASGSQDREFQRSGRNPFAFPQFGHKLGYLGVRKGRVVRIDEPKITALL
jgi:hypothetical protein